MEERHGCLHHQPTTTQTQLQRHTDHLFCYWSYYRHLRLNCNFALTSGAVPPRTVPSSLTYTCLFPSFYLPHQQTHIHPLSLVSATLCRLDQARFVALPLLISPSVTSNKMNTVRTLLAAVAGRYFPVLPHTLHAIVFSAWAIIWSSTSQMYIY
jgi:hypothetical protein